MEEDETVENRLKEEIMNDSINNTHYIDLNYTYLKINKLAYNAEIFY